MKSLSAGLLAGIAIFAFPSTAAAEELVPPGNSAVNQYTETFPTTGGDKEAKGGKKSHPTPAKVLGDRNAQKLEEHGPEGRKVATVAAATAPSPAVTTSPAPEATDDSGGAAGGNGNDSNGGGGDHVAVAPARAVGQSASADKPGSGAGEANGPSGTSGFGEVLAQATGTSSSGELGLLLPLAIAAVAIWALASLWRRTRRTAQ